MTLMDWKDVTAFVAVIMAVTIIVVGIGFLIFNYQELDHKEFNTCVASGAPADRCDGGEY